MSLVIDPEFQALCPPLLPEERDQLEASLLAEGCRDPLCVWEREASVVLLDGHNRYAICEAHHLSFAVQAIPLETHEEAINWIIATQLGRRNLTPEQKSYLRGKQYNLEKRAQGRPKESDTKEQLSEDTSERLGMQYGVASVTIRKDGAFAAAVDTLEDEVRADLREVVLRRQERGKGKATKAKATKAGKLVQDKAVLPQPFMRRPDWKAYQAMEAIEILASIPAEAHDAINILLDQPHIPPMDGLAILKNLQGVSAQALALICRLSTSPDPADQADAKTLAAQKTPPPDRQAERAEYLIRKVEEARRYQRRNWTSQFPGEPWSLDLEAIDTQLAAVQDGWREIAAQANARRAERVATYAATFTAS